LLSCVLLRRRKKARVDCSGLKLATSGSVSGHLVKHGFEGLRRGTRSGRCSASARSLALLKRNRLDIEAGHGGVARLRSAEASPPLSVGRAPQPCSTPANVNPDHLAFGALIAATCPLAGGLHPRSVVSPNFEGGRRFIIEDLVLDRDRREGRLASWRVLLSR